MEQQTKWAATPLHFLNNNTILRSIHTPQGSELTAKRTTAATFRVVAASC